MCLVSFIVPVYNLSNEEISFCVSSLVNQTTCNHEIIIVDDGSNSGVGHYCDIIGEQMGAIVIHQENQGLAVARNTGMSVAHGEWIVHVDGDDWVDQHLVEAIIEKDKVTEADVLVWGFVVDNGVRKTQLLLKNKTAFDGDYQAIKEKVLCSILDYDSTFASLALNTSWGKAYRRSFIIRNQLFYDASLRRAQDAVYNLYAFSSVNKVEYIDETLNYYRTSNVSLSRGFNHKTFDYLHHTALAVQDFVKEIGASSKVNDAASVFIMRCFRMINMQYYQHKENKESYHKRKELFLIGINTEPFKSAFESGIRRPGLKNKIIDFLYAHRMFREIALLDSIMRVGSLTRNSIHKLIHR